MPEFTKKPVTIEAVEFVGFQNGGVTFGDGAAAHPWLDKAMFTARGAPGAIWSERRDPAPTASDPLAQRGAELVLLIGTLEGEHIASPGDWIIRGVQGELYPCKPGIFAATYNAAGAEDYAGMMPGDMLAAVGANGMAWADAFMQIACMANPLGRELRAFPHGDRAPLHGTMLGWFCNAIEAGRAAGERAALRRLYPLFNEAVVMQPIGEERNLVVAYTSNRDAAAAHTALNDIGSEIAMLGPLCPSEGEAREQMADGFAADFDLAAAERAFTKGAGDNARLLGGAEPPTEGEGPTDAEGWKDGVRVVPDERKAAQVARAFIDKHHVSCPEATFSDGVYEEAPLLVEQLAEAVGYYRYPEEM